MGFNVLSTAKVIQHVDEEHPKESGQSSEGRDRKDESKGGRKVKIARGRLRNLERLNFSQVSTLRPVQLGSPYREHVGSRWHSPQGHGSTQTATPR